MILAITVWNDRISPVCDSANTLLLIEVQQSEIIRKRYVPFPYDSPLFQIQTLKNLRVDILLCGAITRYLASIIERNDIQIVSFISGKVNEVLNTFLTDRQLMHRHSMPGMNHWQKNRKQIRHQRGLGKRYQP